jgi:hypothetical protein
VHAGFTFYIFIYANMGQVWSPVLFVTLDLVEKRKYPSVLRPKRVR